MRAVGALNEHFLHALRLHIVMCIHLPLSIKVVYQKRNEFNVLVAELHKKRLMHSIVNFR